MYLIEFNWYELLEFKIYRTICGFINVFLLGYFKNINGSEKIKIKIWAILRDLYKIKDYSDWEVKWCDIVDINFIYFKIVDVYSDYLK